MSEVKALERSSEEKRGERRQRLRDFQSQLLDRMQAARSNDVLSSNQLGVMIGPTRYLLNLRDAGEIVSMGPISQVPLTRDWYLGLLNIRGNLIGVVDIERFQGHPKIDIGLECRVVAFSTKLTFNAGLLVSKVLGLRNVAEMQLQDNAVDQPVAWRKRSYVDENNQRWFELSLHRLIEDSEFLRIGV